MPIQPFSQTIAPTRARHLVRTPLRRVRIGSFWLFGIHSPNRFEFARYGPSAPPWQLPFPSAAWHLRHSFAVGRKMRLLDRIRVSILRIFLVCSVRIVSKAVYQLAPEWDASSGAPACLCPSLFLQCALQAKSRFAFSLSTVPSSSAML